MPRAKPSCVELGEGAGLSMRGRPHRGGRRGWGAALNHPYSASETSGGWGPMVLGGWM